MKAAFSKCGGIQGRLVRSMTRTQALRLKRLAEDAYQPGQYAADLSFDEAARRIDALKAEIALADSFKERRTGKSDSFPEGQDIASRRTPFAGGHAGAICPTHGNRSGIRSNERRN